MAEERSGATVSGQKSLIDKRTGQISFFSVIWRCSKYPFCCDCCSFFLFFFMSFPSFNTITYFGSKLGPLAIYSLTMQSRDMLPSRGESFFYRKENVILTSEHALKRIFHAMGYYWLLEDFLLIHVDWMSLPKSQDCKHSVCGSRIRIGATTFLWQRYRTLLLRYFINPVALRSYVTYLFFDE